MLVTGGFKLHTGLDPHNTLRDQAHREKSDGCGCARRIQRIPSFSAKDHKFAALQSGCYGPGGVLGRRGVGTNDNEHRTNDGR